MSKKLMLIPVSMLIAGTVVFFRFNETKQPLPATAQNAAPAMPHKTKPSKPAFSTIANPPTANAPAVVATPTTPDYATFATMTLWENLLAALKQGDYRQIDLEDALIERLRQESGAEVYQQLLAVFRQGKLTVDAQRVLISILGEITNTAAAETLMQLLEERLIHASDAKLTALRAIDKYSPELWYEHSNAEFAPVFEKAWQKINDPNFLAAMAHVMAKIGTPQSLALFSQTLTDTNNSERVTIVKQAMTDFENPALIVPLAANLQSSPSKNLQWASGYALANMGQDAATAALFNWASHANAAQVDWAKEWFDIAMTTTPTFVQWLNANLATQQFSSAEIKQAVEGALININGQ